MRISDWSSDVCSSDLGAGVDRGQPARAERHAQFPDRAALRRRADVPRAHGPARRPYRRPGHRQNRERGRVLMQWLQDYGLIFDAVICVLLVTAIRSEEHTSELQSLMRISYAVF